MSRTMLRISALALAAFWTASTARGQQPPSSNQPPAKGTQPPAANIPQPTNPNDQPATDPNIHVQARGQIHEAFAQPFEAVVNPKAIIQKKPPDPIREEPPDQRPAGKNVHWIPGYWQWDD